MKVSFNLFKTIAKSDTPKNINNDEEDIPYIDLNRIKKLTMKKIQQDKKKKLLSLRNIGTKAACAIIMVGLISTGSVYAFTNESFQNFIGQLTGVEQRNILVVGEAVSNKDYELKVHELVTDSYVGDVVVSVEALSDKSKKDFNNYRIDLKHIGSGYGLGELEEYREKYIKYYKISFSGATHRNSRNDGKLKFSFEGMKQEIDVSLTPTVERMDMDIPGDNSNGYQYKFNKLHLSEIGLTLEGTDTRNMACEYWYNIELLFADGTKELLEKKMNENCLETHITDNAENSSSKEETYNDGSKTVSQNAIAVPKNKITDTSISGNLISGASGGHSGDDGNYVYISMSFSKNLPLDTIKQVIINGIAYDIER